MRLLTCVFLAAAAASCTTGPTWFGGDWTRGAPKTNAALVDGATLFQWSRGRGPSRETRWALQVDGVEVDVDSTEELVAHCRDLLELENAIAYSDLVRRLLPNDAGLAGSVVLPDRASDGPGGSGTYTQQDAVRWGIAFGPRARKFAGGVEVTVLVLIPPIRHPDLSFSSPFRLVQQDETIYPDGTVRPGRQQIVTNGDDAQRFAVY